MVELVQKQTNAGTLYSVIEDECTVEYEYISAEGGSKVDGENRYWTLYLPMSEVRNKAFPLNANPRKPNSIGSNESTDIVVKMRGTLSREPEKFVRLNNGLTCVCSKVDLNEKDGTIGISWGKGEGILNGGHTYLAIQTNSTVTKSVVRVEVIEICNRLNLEENQEEKRHFIKETAIARNANRQLKDFTRSEFEGKHQFFQDHLGDLKGVIYWSEGYEDLLREPFSFSERSAMKAAVFVRYLALLDQNWHWHPSSNPDPHDDKILNNLLVSGSGTYDQWNSVALEPHNQKNLQRVAPLSRMLLKLVDRIRLSMKYEADASGRTTNPIGCGNMFTAGEFFRSWAGARQGKERTFYDKGLDKVPKSSPHFVAYMINSTRPFIWTGERGLDETDLIGWYSNPIEMYDKFYQAVIKSLNPDFSLFKNGRDMASHNGTASGIWRNHVKPIWYEECSNNPNDEKFYPETFFDPESEKWYSKNGVGNWILAYDETDQEWTILQRDPSSDEQYSRYYSVLESQPF